MGAVTIEPIFYGEKWCLRGKVGKWPRMIIADTREELESWMEANA